MWAGHLGSPGGVREAAEAALAAPPAPDPPRAADVLLDTLALRFTQGYAAAVPALTWALELLLALDSSPGQARGWLWPIGAHGASSLIAAELWDFESWHALAAGQVQAARDTGAFAHLQFALNLLAIVHLLVGELAAAAEVLDEDRLIADATGNPPVAAATMALAAWRGQEREAAALIEASVQAATARGVGRLADFADYASAVLYNGLGRHDAARDAARRAFERDQLGFGPFIVPELAEAASRTGDLGVFGPGPAWQRVVARRMPGSESPAMRLTSSYWPLITAALRAFSLTFSITQRDAF
jgi:tetratricopeptide (TPR) repeat protein